MKTDYLAHMALHDIALQREPGKLFKLTFTEQRSITFKVRARSSAEAAAIGMELKKAGECLTVEAL